MSPNPEMDRQCSHINARGRRCRMLRAPDHQSLCAHHLRQTAAAPPDQETLAAELLASTGRLSSAAEVNTLLGNLVHQLARKRIDRKDAIAIAYMSQLLLCSLSPLEKQIAAQQQAASNRAYAQRLEEIRIARAKEAVALLAPQKTPVPSSQPVAPPASASPDPPPSQPPKTYADVRT